MPALSHPSRREQTRYALTGQFEGKWIKSDQEAIEVLPVDVSEKGLGLLVNPPPKIGDEVHWFAPKNKNPIKLKIVWTLDADANHDLSEIINMRRCGLILIDSSEQSAINLLEICTTMSSLHVLE